MRTGTASGNQNSSATFALPAGLLSAGQDNVISVLVRNMGHNEDGGKNDAQKAPRGLLSASVVGSDAPVSWRIQGVRGGEALVDRVRGPQNNGGLYGERSGWSLPGFDDSAWESVSLPHRESAPGCVVVPHAGSGSTCRATRTCPSACASPTIRRATTAC